MTVTLPDGAQIAWYDEGSGTPVVLLHGLMAHGGFYREQAPLAADFRLINIDLRGHGASVHDGEQPTVERIAQDVTELCEKLDLKDAIGVGWTTRSPTSRPSWCSALPPATRRASAS